MMKDAYTQPMSEVYELKMQIVMLYFSRNNSMALIKITELLNTVFNGNLKFRTYRPDQFEKILII